MKRRHPNDWPPEQTEELLRLSLLDISAATIANVMWDSFGVPRTRNAILGKIHRLKRAGREVGPQWCRGPRSSWAPEAAKPAKEQGPARKRGRRPTLQSPRSQPLPPARKHTRRNAKTAVPFINRAHGQCAYPLWDHEVRTGDVCGADVDVTAGFQFCSGHAAICFQRRA